MKLEEIRKFCSSHIGCEECGFNNNFKSCLESLVDEFNGLSEEKDRLEVVRKEALNGIRRSLNKL